MISLVGYTGFVGSNIYDCAQGTIDGAYNSKNIEDAYGTKPELLIYAGLRAEKYLANSDPQKDMSLITEAEKKRLRSYDLLIRVSTESQGMGIYKSFNYEIFERRPSVVVALDGNSAAANIIQEAKNGKGKSDIYVWGHSKTLRQKADSLQGYVRIFDEENPLGRLISDRR